MPDSSVTTGIARHMSGAVYVRRADLVQDLMGKLTFTEMILFHLTGQRPSRAATVVLDAVLVTLMEQGLTPSAIVTRLIYDSAPEALHSTGPMGAS